MDESHQKSQQHQHMKKDRINDEPSKSNSPLDQTTDPSRQNPFSDAEDLRYSCPCSSTANPGHQGPPANLSGHLVRWSLFIAPPVRS